MYARYSYSAGSGVADILSDVVAILTGTTDKATLSASCNQSSTEIISDVVAGWTLHDVYAGTNQQCLKAPLADDAATFKYLCIDLNSSGYLLPRVYETWDEINHDGTNMCYSSNSTSYNQKIDIASGGSLYIWASERFAMFASQTSAGWASSSYPGPSGILERTRYLPWDTPANGWPPFFWSNLGNANQGTFGYAPRIMKRDGSPLISNSAVYHPGSVCFNSLSVPVGSDQKIPDGNDGSVIPAWPLMAHNVSHMPMMYGEVSSLCDIWAIPESMATTHDILVMNGINYVVVRTNGVTDSMILRKG
uniref:Uncharacterized protein n=1 Tax=Magnetococcus massalia (strain MO-1) TaxID=451514 RepID=A0A1S7LIB8_MAGMO|nr:Conserved protein of unknown function [Candidatus Magnetococcus massalia]